MTDTSRNDDYLAGTDTRFRYPISNRVTPWMKRS